MEHDVGKFKRHDTPHPKHEVGAGPKLKGKPQIDGHVIPHEGGKKSKDEAVLQLGTETRKASRASEFAGDEISSESQRPTPSKRLGILTMRYLSVEIVFIPTF